VKYKKQKRKEGTLKRKEGRKEGRNSKKEGRKEPQKRKEGSLIHEMDLIQ
jgi:hypothetical protein